MRAHIVTGVSRGLGLALARQLLADPAARLVGVARHAPAALAAAFGDRFRFVAADLSRLDEVAQLMPRLLSALGTGPFVSIDLINNAGVVAPIALAGQYPPHAVIDAIAINLAAPLLLTNAFLAQAPALTRDARVMNISSGAAAKAYPGWGVYGASKAALDHFSRHAAQEQAATAQGARIAALYPGVVDTDMQANIRASNEADFPLKARFDALKADGGLSSPEDAARRILHHLRSDGFGNEPVVDIRNLSSD